MQRTKTLSLTTQIFNKLSSKTFINTTCPSHQNHLPIYLCTNCISNPLCELCYNQHICPQKNNINSQTQQNETNPNPNNEKSKTNKQISKWISQKQQQIVKTITNIQKQIDTSKNNIQPNKFIISQNNITLSQLNTNIISYFNNQTNNIKSQIQILINSTITSTNTRQLQNFINNVNLNLNKINTLQEIQQFTQNSKKYSQNSIKNIQNQHQQLKTQCQQLFKKTLQNTIFKILQQFQNLPQNESKTKQQTTNLITIENLKNQIINLQKQKNIQNQKQKYLIKQLQKLQQNLKQTQNYCSSFKTQSDQTISNLQSTINTLTQNNQSLNSKIQQFQTSTPSVNEQLKQQKIQNNLLQHKIKQYEQQLANQARTQAGGQQNLTDRFDVQEVLRRVGELEEKCQELTIQGHAKDRKIVDMISEVNRMQIKIKDGRSPQGSARKPSN